MMDAIALCLTGNLQGWFMNLYMGRLISCRILTELTATIEVIDRVRARGVKYEHKQDLTITKRKGLEIAGVSDETSTEDCLELDKNDLVTVTKIGIKELVTMARK